MDSRGGVLLLSNISLVSVGFASWTIGGAISADAEIKVTVDDVIEDAYAIILDDEVFDFSIGVDGLIVDHVISQKASMSFSFHVNNENGNSFLSSDNCFSVISTLTETSSTSFLTYVDKKPSCSAATSIGDNTSSSDNKITNLVTFEKSQDSITSVTIVYSINDSNNEIGTNFYNNLPRFSFYVSLEEPV